ncbi:MAG: Gfo/Idh/MocA family protein, partial [Polyangiaceae bacterium]
VEHLGGYPQMEQIARAAEVDAVYIALPNAMHREFTERAAKAGLHVLCEKPMAVTVEDCEAMIAATRAANVKLMIAYRLHFEEANLTAIDRVRDGIIGEPRIFSSVFSQQVREGDIRTRGELGGGAMYDMGIYCINAARYLFRDEPLEILATQVKDVDARFHDVDATTTAILRFAGGRIAQFSACEAAGDVSEYRVIGTKGDIRLDPAYGYARGLTEYLTVDESTKRTSFSKRDQFAPELVHFSDSIIGDTEPEPSGEEGLCDVRVLEAIKRSAATGSVVRLAPFDRSNRPNPRLQMNKRAVGKIEPIHAPPPSK